MADTKLIDREYIVCVGDTVLDHLIEGVGKYPDPSKSVPCKAISWHMGGMGANCATAIKRLGKASALVTWLNKSDNAGRVIFEKLGERGFSSTDLFIKDAPGVETRQCLCFVDKGEMHERSFMSPDVISPLDVRFLKEHEDLLRRAKIVHFAGIGNLPIVDNTSAELVALLRRLKGKDGYPKFSADTLFNENVLGSPRWKRSVTPFMEILDYFLPSHTEVNLIIPDWELDFSHIKDGRDLDKQQKDRISAAISDLRDTMGCHTIILKLGEYGVWYGGEDDVKNQYCDPFPLRDVVDMTGAGDAWCAGFLTGKLLDFCDLRACAMGNATAMHCIQKLGATAGIRNLKEVLPLLDQKLWAKCP